MVIVVNRTFLIALALLCFLSITYISFRVSWTDTVAVGEDGPANRPAGLMDKLTSVLDESPSIKPWFPLIVIACEAFFVAGVILLIKRLRSGRMGSLSEIPARVQAFLDTAETKDTGVLAFGVGQFGPMVLVYFDRRYGVPIVYLDGLELGANRFGRATELAKELGAKFIIDHAESEHPVRHARFPEPPLLAEFAERFLREVCGVDPNSRLEFHTGYGMLK